MAESVRGTSPLAHALQSLGVSKKDSPAVPTDPKVAFEGLARETNVPANVLMALDEAEGGNADLDRARRNAAFLGERISSGAAIEDAVAELAGDPKRGASLMDRSYDIADALYPEPAAPVKEPGIGTDLTDFAKAFGAGAVNSAGGAVQALGAVVDDGLRQGARSEIEASGGDPSTVTGESVLRSGARGAADAVRGVGDDLMGAISERGQKAMQGFQPGGELTDPSSWTLGEDPSVRGAALQVGQGLGSMAPVVAAGAVGGPGAAAAVGALSSAGEGAQSGRDFVEAARGRDGEAGPAYIEALPGYQDRRAQGMSHEDAAAELARATESEAGAWQAIPGALGGAATQRIMRGADGFLNAGGRLARAGKKAAAGALEEGVQEAAEGMAAQGGIADATGADLNTQEDSFANFMLGAMTGGVMGAGAGLVSPGETEREQSDAPTTTDNTPAGAAPVAPQDGGGSMFGRTAAQADAPAPAPYRAAPLPDAATEAERIFAARPDTMDLPGDAAALPEIDGEFTEISPAQNTGPDGSGVGAVAAPGGRASLSAPSGAAATNPQPAPGPVAQAALSIMDATPAPAPDVAQIFPEHKPGSAIRLGDEATGEIMDGVFMGETPEGKAQVRVKGQTLDLSPQDFDTFRDAAPRIEEARKLAEKNAKTSESPATQEQRRDPASWVIRDKATGEAVMETFEKATADRVNTERYEAVPIIDHLAGLNQPKEQPARPEPASAAPVIEPIRQKASILRGWDRPEPPTVPGVSIKHDAKEGGWIFSRKQEDKVREALGIGVVTAPAVGQGNSQQTLGNEVLTAPNDGQASTAPDWPWAGKKINIKNRAKATADYLSPGNIIESYGGGRDRVVSFDAKEGAITVEGMEQRGGEWVPNGERRIHSTLPEDRAVLRGPISRPAQNPIAAAAAEAIPEPTEANKGPTARTTGPDTGDMTEAEAFDALAAIMDERGDRLTGGGFRHNGKLVTYSDGQWWGTNRVKGAENKVFINAENSLDAFYFDRAALTKAVQARRTNNPPKESDDKPAFTKKGAVGDFSYGYVGKSQWEVRNAAGETVGTARALNEASRLAERLNGGITKKTAAGILSSLSQEKQARAADLKARLAAKARTQASSGLDPEYITLGGELVALYIEAGTKRFGQMLRDFAETTGLSLKEAQAPMRAAYNHVRDDMDLNGQDVSDMDDAAAVMSEVRKALAGEAAPASKDDQKGKPQQEQEPVPKDPNPTNDQIKKNPLPDPSPRATAIADALGLRDEYSAGRIQEEADREGWDRLAFQFRVSHEGGRQTFVWTDANGKILSRMKKMGPFAGLQRGEYRDPISGFVTMDAAEFRPADLFRHVAPKPTTTSTAPEHAAVGVDDRELAEIVSEFSDAEAAMRDGGDKIHHLFDRPTKGEVVRLAQKTRVHHAEHGWMTPAEARARIAEWKDHARAQGGAGSANADKIVLSLFDLTGSWSRPWEEAGYQVYRFDIQDDPEVGDVNNFSTEFFGDWFGDFDGQDIYAILAACPCTDFAVSGAKHFAAKDADGRTVASVKLVHQTLATIEHFRPAVWAIENPVGRIEKLGGLPPWRLSFDPNDLGDTYTKKTLLWGRFNGDLPIAPVEPVEGSKMHSKYGGKSLATKNARSATPEGFAYGFFMANNAVDHPAMALANKFDRLDRQLIEDAVAQGVTPEAITEAVEDPYFIELDDAAANEAIRDLMGDGGPQGSVPAEKPERDPIQKAKDRVMRLRREKPNSPELAQAESDLRKARQNAFADDTPAQPGPAPQKRPLIRYVTDALGGIDPTGAVARELQHRGITTRTAPGLFRKGGHLDMDNVPASEHPDLAALVGTDDTGNYLDAAAIIEGIAEEVAGRAQPLGEQAALQENARATAEALSHIRDQEANHIIVPRADDPRTDAERRDAVSRAVNDFSDRYMNGALTDAERRSIIETLTLAGGLVEAATEDAIMRRPLDDLGTAESQDAGIPFGDAGGDPQPGSAGFAADGSQAPGEGAGWLPAEERGTRGEGSVNGEGGGSENPALADAGGAEGGRRGYRGRAASGAGPQGSDRGVAQGSAADGGAAGGVEPADGSRPGDVESVRPRGAGVSVGGNEPNGRPRASRKRLADPDRRKPVAPAGRPDYVLTDPERIVGGGPKARFARNRAAIEAIQSIEAEGREPTAEELDNMAAYMGWGSFGQELFQGSWEYARPKDGWKAESDWLRAHLGEAQWKSANASIINAHYTDPPTVMAMWDMVRAMGFTGGRVLEPSMGIGNFFSMMPKDLAEKSERTGIELDKLTGSMAKVLFPQSNISIKGYQDSHTPDGFYDLVIGNWPFASQSPADRRYDRLGPSLHDYFFLKALDQTRAGGIVMGVTSAGTMDKKGRATRIELAKKADLIAAYRLPSGAFDKYAGTAVVTDILIFKKRADTNADAASAPWIDTMDYAAPNGTIHVNRYFIENPDAVLGRLDYGSGSTYGRAAMIVHREPSFIDKLNELRQLVPSKVFDPIKRGVEPRFIKNLTADRQGAITTGPDGNGLYIVQGERLADLRDVAKYEVKDAKQTAAREAEIRGLVDMRRAYGALIDAERIGDDAEKPRAELKRQYEAFRKANGPIKDSFGIGVMKRVKDSFAPALLSLERPDGTPAAILSRSTMRGAPALESVSVADAYALNRNQTTALDMEAVAEAAGVTVEDAIDELLDRGAVLRIPGGSVEPKDTYLSGNVRRKLREVLGAIETGETELAATADALRAVQPSSVPYFDIEARLGAPWVRADDYRQFAADLIGLPKIGADQMDVRTVGGSWKVTFKDKALNRRPEARSGYGLGAYPFSRLLEAAMGNRTITLRTKDEDGKDVVDEARTAEANAAATKIRERFQEWIWEDAERTADLESAYNDMMRGIADPQYDGDFLTFPGMALQRGEQSFNLRKHQRDAIWRGIYNERGLYAHEVGTGKTFTMAGIAVESRRYGKAKKPLLLAHNANRASVYAEAQEMYPGGQFLYIDNLDKDSIETAMRRIANDDWDAIIMPHSLLSRIGFKEETLTALAAEEIAALEQEALEAAEEDGASLDMADMDDPDAMKKVRSVTAKNLVKQRNAILEGIKKAANRASKEGAIPFEELGIDMVLVDEAHEFKKPPIATKMQMKGLNTSASGRSIALKFMTDYVKSQRGGTGVHLFTGTPITNTLNEIFNMMRYVMDSEMKRDGVESWDLWFNTFADASTDVEVQSTGEFEAVTRLAQFVNVSELRRMAGQVLDIVFASDMPEFKPRETKSGKTLKDPTLTDAERDELLNGRTENAIGRPYKLVRTDVGQMSAAQRGVMQQVVQWSRNFKQAAKKQRREYMLSGSEESPIIHEGIAAKAGLDPRLYDARSEDHPESKVNRSVRNLMHHYRESDDGAQVVFVEQGYRAKAKPGMGKPFSLVDDLISKLVAQGVPEAQIAVVAGGTTPEKKKAIADAVSAGKIRIVIGQTGTLGVGVNMQKRLRAMHHLDAPWMPGDLEQRNGRGERQGNMWNTVLEYRYLTEGIDGRRWQVLAIKDRFIKAFLRADDTIRVIDGDAVDSGESESGDSIAATLSEATGDPRLLQREKFAKDVERLEMRERQHKMGIAQASRAARKEREDADKREATLGDRRADAEVVNAIREAGTFEATIGAETFVERADAEKAFSDALAKLAQGYRDVKIATVQGFDVLATKRFSDGIDPDLTVKGKGKTNYEAGRATLRSIEATIRNIPGLVDFVMRAAEESRAAADRLDAQAARPFSQAEKLAKRRQLLEDLEADLEANPAAPPSWLRHGAPVGTEIFVDGDRREVQGHRWTDDGYFIVTEDGAVPYLDAKAENGSALYEAHEFESPVKDHSRPEEGEKQSRFDQGEDPSTITPTQARAINAAALRTLEAVGLLGKIGLKVEAGRMVGASGTYRRGVISILRDGANGWRHTLDHEIIHALRDPTRWGARHGLFSADEWQALVGAARRNEAIRARVMDAYSDLDTAGQSEEMVAELYADWAQSRGAVPAGPLGRAFETIRSFFRAAASAMRGEGFLDAARIMERIAAGEVGGRGPDGSGPGRAAPQAREQRDMSAIKAALSQSPGRLRGMVGSLHWKKAPGFFSSLLTDAMGKNDSFNILSLVPGHPLFEELGKALPAAQKYMREKQTMDAWRNDWQARAAKVVDGWSSKARKAPEANDKLMDLMHASTLAGIDPSRADSWRRPVDDEARRALKGPRLSAAKQEWAQGVIRDANDRERTWHRLRADYDAMPADFRDLYQQIRDEYAAMADEQDAALMANIRTASKIALKRADREHRKELQRIKDEGLTGNERADALEKANKRKTDAHARAARGGGARMQHLRQMFESNKLAGPYFPLARFGNYFVTLRDEDGKVTSFSRFQTEAQQRAWIRTATERGLGKVEHGVLGGDANLKGQVDPSFVAEVESLLAEAGASDEMMDSVWQRWLETLPDQSVRTNRIHRKGRMGFNKDAMRAFSSAMFHGAHQTARLRHGLEMQDALDDAEDQAKQQDNPNRAGFVVREMRQRHAFTMSPTNNPLVSSLSGLAFVWYLGMSPASAIVNLSQTTIVGVPLLAARFKKAGVTGTTAELARALRDFGSGRGWAEQSDRLSQDEKAAMKAGYDRGVIDKTQSHDLAAVAESGIQYNPTREKIMRVIGWGFHHTERLNREVTYLAAYRMARAEGLGEGDAVDEASRQVWRVHFDYQNTSRPRVMQSDMGKVLTIFRNFTVNMLYRLFRDLHQAFNASDKATRQEARAQLIGISLSMFAHAGIKGVWGFGLLSMLLGAFLPGDDDDFENWLQDALLVEGDGPGVAAWNWIMGMALNGVPGTVLDTDLTNRIGMPDLWFRGSQKDLEGKDLWAYYVEQMAGPVAGIGGSVATGLSMIADGEWQRGAEKVVPKFAGNLIKSARYVEDGVTTYNGDPIIDGVNPYEAMTTAMGFTPARVAERYRANSWMKNQEAKITGDRKDIMGDIARSIKAGDGVTPDLASRVKEWNLKYPFYPITADSLRQSIASRQRMSQHTQGGVSLNPKLDRHLREQVAPSAR